MKRRYIRSQITPTFTLKMNNRTKFCNQKFVKTETKGKLKQISVHWVDNHSVGQSKYPDLVFLAIIWHCVLNRRHSFIAIHSWLD